MALCIASTIIFFWLVGLAVEFASFPQLSYPEISAVVFGQTFLHTGLFITAHEAIHGNIFARRAVNRAIGQTVLWLYAGLDYQPLAKRHYQHHQYPASHKDPDFCQHPEHRFWPWYFSFMQQYQSGKQIWRFLLWLLAWLTILQICHISLTAFVCFCLLPLVISSLQLFIFGIFLPHRPSPYRQDNLHRASSTNLPVLLSLVTCYHFGYHWEHHQYPKVPWYKLPSLKRQAGQTITKA